MSTFVTRLIFTCERIERVQPRRKRRPLCVTLSTAFDPLRPEASLCEGKVTADGTRRETTLPAKRLANGECPKKLRNELDVPSKSCSHFSTSFVNSFRDRLHTEYRSSSKAKISRRKDTTSTRNPSMPLVDFDEYVASPDHASQNQLHLVTPSAGLQQSNSSGRHLPGWPSGHPTATTEHPPPPSGGDFPVPVVRRKTNFQGLADVYFGDAPSANPPHSASQRSERQQPHEDLLGSLTHNSSRDSTRTYYNAMNAHPSMTHSRSSSMNMMDHNMRGHELDHHQRHHSAAYFEGGSSNFSHGNQHQMMMMRYPTAHANTNSFASLPPNAFAADRSEMFGGVPENIPLQETHMESSQRLSGIPMMATSMGYHRRSGGMEMMAMEAFKGMGGYMQQHAGASWQARSERKPPPMQPTMFEAPPTFAKERVQERVIPEREAPQAEHQVKASPEGLDSSGESSRIPDDEPLPLH